ncbi:GIY-YIG nuclease family protein [bacterium]|nr:GIY-YIG nuclease family protein [bacterium]
MNKKYYVYIILTTTGKLYCGYTDDVEKRYNLHCVGKGAKFTRANKPLKLVYTREFETKQDAQKEEYRIKHLSRLEKEKLIQNKEV